MIPGLKAFRKKPASAGAAAWQVHQNKTDQAVRDASEVLRKAGFVPSKIYGNLAGIANRLRLPALGDNTRFLQMGLLAQEIERRGVEGAIAELGVYRGGFTKFISRAFRNRRYYLFDTFEGFDEKQIARDTKVFNASGHDFTDTSVEHVLGMIDPDSRCEVIVRKGFFPSTAEGLEDTFAFVSLDADLYDPTLDGLKYFYPRMAQGGYIMVHDLMAERYQGCRKAVYEFCNDQKIFFVPLPDAICSALIVKT